MPTTNKSGLPDHMQADSLDVEEMVNQNKLRQDAARIRKHIFQTDSTIRDPREINEIVKNWAQHCVKYLPPVSATNIEIVTTRHSENIGLTKPKVRGIYADRSYYHVIEKDINWSDSAETNTWLIRHKLNQYIKEVVMAAVEAAETTLSSEHA